MRRIGVVLGAEILLSLASTVAAQTFGPNVSPDPRFGMYVAPLDTGGRITKLTNPKGETIFETNTDSEGNVTVLQSAFDKMSVPTGGRPDWAKMAADAKGRVAASGYEARVTGIARDAAGRVAAKGMDVGGERVVLNFKYAGNSTGPLNLMPVAVRVPGEGWVSTVMDPKDPASLNEFMARMAQATKIHADIKAGIVSPGARPAAPDCNDPPPVTQDIAGAGRNTSCDDGGSDSSQPGGSHSGDSAIDITRESPAALRTAATCMRLVMQCQQVTSLRLSSAMLTCSTFGMVYTVPSMMQAATAECTRDAIETRIVESTACNTPVSCAPTP